MRLPPGTDATGALGFTREVHAASRMVLPKTAVLATTTRSIAVSTNFNLRASFFTLDLLFCFLTEVPTPSFYSFFMGGNEESQKQLHSQECLFHIAHLLVNNGVPQVRKCLLQG